MADGGQVTVVATPSVFRPDSAVYCQAAAGQTLAQLLGEGASHSLQVRVGGQVVPRPLWDKVRPKAGQRVHVVNYPQGGGNGSKYLRTALLIVLMVYAPEIAAGLGMPGATGTALVMMGGQLAINALVPPPTPKGLSHQSGDPFQQLNSLTGTSNQLNPYGVIPCVVGTKRFFPPHAALPYTEIVGQDQYLRMLLDLGYGDLEISDIQIAGADISGYQDVEWQIGTNPTLFSQDIYEASVGVTLTVSGDEAIRTTQVASTEISLDLLFGSGLYGVDATGATVTGLVEMHIVYRPVGTTTWLGIDNATGVTFSGGGELNNGGYDTIQIRSNKRSTLRLGVRWTVPSGQYEVRVTRGTTSFSGAGYNGTGGTAVENGTSGDCTWTVLRSVSPQLPSTTGTTKLAVRIRATDQINGVVQNLSVLASQLIRRWDASTQTFAAPAVSTNPGAIYPWLLTECPAVIRRLTDDRIDWDGMAAWADDCTARNLQIGFVMDTARPLGDWGRDVLAAGRASPGQRNGKYSAVRDVAQTVPVQMFTPANSRGFSYTRAFNDLPHALRVKFTNPEAADQQDYTTVYWDGYSLDGAGGTQIATRFEELDLAMVIDPEAAWRLGRYHLSVMWLRPNQYTLQADVEHIVCERGDLIHAGHDITGWGVAYGRVKSVSGTTVVLDGPVTLEAGKTYQLRVRPGDNTQDTATITTAAGTTDTLTVDAALGSPGDLYLLGEVGHGVAELIVRKIEPGPDLSATLTCVDAAPGVWTCDSGTPPTFVSEITGKFWCDAPPLPEIIIRAGSSAPDNAGVILAETGVSGGGSAGGGSGGGVIRPGTGHGGIGCVVVESFLPDMRRAGDVAAGDTMALADESTLAPRTGTVSYAEPKMQPCVEIITASGARLRCSTSAPIPTPRGLVLAPHLAGRQVAVMDGDGTRWEAVHLVRAIGQRMVQHITVGNACFWAGAEQGRYILHHNVKQSIRQPEPI